MFDLGFFELLLIGIVALLVVGPEELPHLFRKAGRFMAQARHMAGEFTRAMEDAADQSGAKEAGEELKRATQGFNDMRNPARTIQREMNKAAKSAMELDPESESGKLAAKRQQEQLNRNSERSGPQKNTAEIAPESSHSKNAKPED